MKSWTRVFVWTVLLVMLLAACVPSQVEETDELVLWFAGNTEEWNPETTALAAEVYSGPLSVEGMMTALLVGSSDGRLVSPIPSGTRLLGWSLEKDGTLLVDLSGEYAALAGVDLTLADYCIALTLEQLPNVQRVRVTAEGRSAAQRRYQVLSGEQVILSGAEEQPVEVSAVLYFPRLAGRGLGFENRTFQMTEDDVLAEMVTRALLEGPGSTQLTSLIPEGTQLLSTRLEDGVCYVDLSAALVEQMPPDEDSQTLIIYSLVDTLGNLDSVDSVVLRVEGVTLERYGSVMFADGLEPDFGLVGSH